MALDPKQILNQLEQNLARQNYFTFNVTIPNIIATNITSEFASWYIRAASIPSLSANLVEVKHLGKLKYALVSATVDTINVTFYDTKEQDLRKLWVQYLEEVTMNNQYAILKYYPNEYQTKGTIEVEDTTWDITGMSPISVGDFILDYDNDSSLGTFDVTFKVKSCK